jgi:hypothetical protein
MTRISKKSKDLPGQRFRTADPTSKTVFLDVGRAEVMLNMIMTPDLMIGETLHHFVGAVHGASKGDSAVMKVLIKSCRHWDEFDTKSARTRLRDVWNSFNGNPPAFDCVAYLRRICTEQSYPLPDTMVEALFDGLSFDFIAYLKWHNSPG